MCLGLIGVFDVLRYAAGPGSGALPSAGGRGPRASGQEEWVADLRGATVVDLISPEQQAAIVARLGPDPLRAGGPGMTPHTHWPSSPRTDRPVAELLMDQSVLAGVGNVYRCELLWKHRIDPFTPGRLGQKRTWQTIWDDLVDLMPIGVAFGQIHHARRAGRPRAKAFLAQRAKPATRHTSWTWQGGTEGESAGGCPPDNGDPPMSRSVRSRGEYAVYKSARASHVRCAAAEFARRCSPGATSSGAAAASGDTDLRIHPRRARGTP